MVSTASNDFEALVDTGFDGYVAVPLSVIPADSEPDFLIPWTLADGSEVETPTYLGHVQLGDAPPSPVLVTVLGDEAIVGQAVVRRYRLILDHGQRVIVEV